MIRTKNDQSWSRRTITQEFFALLMTFFVSPIFAHAQHFSVSDLGSLNPGGVIDVSYGNALNNLDQIVGSSYTRALTLNAFLWNSTSGMLDLGTLGGSSSIAWGINDVGQVVGEAEKSDGIQNAFLWSEGRGMQDLGSLGGVGSVAYAINIQGQVVGTAAVAEGPCHAFLWTQAGGMQDLGTLGGSRSIAYAINDRGQVVGASLVSGDVGTHAFLWTAGRGMKDLGTVQGWPSIALGINSVGQVVGYTGTTQAGQSAIGLFWNSLKPGIFPFIAGSAQTLPTAINDLGQVTGQFLYPSGDAYAFLYTVNLGIQDLNELIPQASGWILEAATGINMHGQMTGWGTVAKKSGTVNHAFLLTEAP